MWRGPFDLENRNVVITGGATGIGFAIEARYAQIRKAYESYAPRYEGDEEYDVPYLISQMSRQKG